MNSRIRLLLLMTSLILCGVLSPAQTKLDLRSQSKSVDFGDAPSTRPVKVGSSMPALCTKGELFFRDGVNPGNNLYGCTATNVWTLLSGQVAIDPGPANTFMGSDGASTQWRLFSAGPSGAVSVNFSAGNANVDIDTTVVPRKAVSETISGLWSFPKGLLMPAMTAPGSPAEGQMFIDSSTNLLRWYSGGAMRTAGTGGGDTFGTSGTTAGQLTIFADSSGKQLGKYTGSGLLKAASGVVSSVTGTASDCVRVDGSSGSCGTATTVKTPVIYRLPLAGNGQYNSGWAPASGSTLVITVDDPMRLGVVRFPASADSVYVYNHVQIPQGWDGTAPTAKVMYVVGTVTSGNTVRWQMSIACAATGGPTGTITYATDTDLLDTGVASTSFRLVSGSVTAPGSCAAGQVALIRIRRNGTNDTAVGNADLAEVSLVFNTTVAQ